MRKDDRKIKKNWTFELELSVYNVFLLTEDIDPFQSFDDATIYQQASQLSLSGTKHLVYPSNAQSKDKEEIKDKRDLVVVAQSKGGAKEKLKKR